MYVRMNAYPETQHSACKHATNSMLVRRRIFVSESIYTARLCVITSIVDCNNTQQCTASPRARPWAHAVRANTQTKTSCYLLSEVVQINVISAIIRRCSKRDVVTPHDSAVGLCGLQSSDVTCTFFCTVRSTNIIIPPPPSSLH